MKRSHFKRSIQI